MILKLYMMAVLELFHYGSLIKKIMCMWHKKSDFHAWIFCDWLAQLQCKSNSEINHSVFCSLFVR